MSNIQLIRPINPKLAPYIESYLFPIWDLHYVNTKCNGILEVMPSPSSSLILFFSEPSHFYTNDSLNQYHEFILTGYYSKPKRIVRNSNLNQMIIRFSPIGIQLLLDFQLSEILDSYASIEGVFKGDFDMLKSRMFSAKSNEERVSFFEDYMMNKLSTTKQIDTRSIALVNYIYARNGTQSLMEISKELGMGERTIQRIIQKYVGINFKLFSKLIRFHQASKCLSGTGNKSKISELAYNLNYFDQAHFIHDFKSFSNLTPSQFIHKNNSSELFDIPNQLNYK